MSPLEILIVDDHPVFRFGIRSLLESSPEYAVVGEAVTGEEAVRLAEELQPDVILMDLQMPHMNGVDAIRQIMETSPHIKILVVSMFEDDGSVFAAMRAGARGYLLKDAEKGDMLRAIQAVGRGEAIFSPSIASRVLSFFSASFPLAQRRIFPQLTEREREILHLIASGAANAEIAERLHLSQKTVSNYVSNIFSKLQVADRAEAIIRARDAGLGRD